VLLGNVIRQDVQRLQVRRLRQTLASHVFLKEEGLNISLTASLGIASFPDDARTKADLIAKADEAMYLVKRVSRNGIAAANQGMVV